MPLPGSVAGATKIVDNGPDLVKFVFVIAGDGFTAGQQGAFETAVDALLSTFQSTAPFDEPGVWNEINVYRMDAHSAASGAVNPSSCTDDPSGYVPVAPLDAGTATYYGATYCTGGVRRLLTLTEESQFFADLDTHVPAWDACIVAVNHGEYGGSGNGFKGLAVYSLHPLATQIAVLESATRSGSPTSTTWGRTTGTRASTRTIRT